ncbi:MAG: hypothetical protein AAB822_01175 [Patescibacteria group bacterium]
MDSNPYNQNQTIDLSSGAKKTSNNGFVSKNSVQFGDSRNSYDNNYSSGFQGGILTKLVMRLSGGAIKTVNQAQLVLLGVMMIAVVITLTMIFKGGSKSSPVDAKKAKEQMDKMLKMQPPSPTQPQ